MGVTIVERKTSGGSSWHVRWSNGRDNPVVHLGTEREYKYALDRKLEAEAMIRRDGAPSRELLDQKKSAEKNTFADVAERWLAQQRHITEGTRRDRRSHIARFNLKWKNSPVESITRHAVQQLIIELENEGLAGTTIDQYLTTLRPIIRDAAGLRHEWLVGKNKQGRLSVKEDPPEALDLPDAKRRAGARRYLSPTRKLIFDILEHGGLRLAEAVCLTWGQIDNEQDALVRIGTKGVKRRGKQPRIVERLDFQPSWIPGSPGHSIQRPEGASGTTRVFPLENVTGSNFRKAMYRSMKKAGVERFTPKALRALHATRLNRWSRGRDAKHDLGLYEMALRMGHSQLLFTTAYAGAIPPD